MTRILIALTFAAMLLAQSVDTALEGSWTVTGAQHGGKAMESMTGGVMKVTADRFEIRTASGNVLKGQLRIDAAKKPARVALLHDSGLRWEAIYEVSGDNFRLNYVDASASDPLPTTFQTSVETEATLVLLTRLRQ